MFIWHYLQNVVCNVTTGMGIDYLFAIVDCKSVNCDVLSNTL